MNRRDVFGVFVFLLTLAAWGVANGQEVSAPEYNEGNERYRQGHYLEAAAQYEKVLAQGIRNGFVYHNLGNAYFKAGEIGQSVLAYERALRLIPGDDDVRVNLRFVNAMKVDREPDVNENMVTRVLSGLYGMLRVGGLAVFCSLCLFGGFGFGICWLFNPRLRLVWVGLVVLMGAGLLGGGSLLALKIHDREAVQEAVILVDEAIGRSGPSEDYLQVFTVHEGTKVTLERTEKNWFLVRLSSGVGGWIRKGAMERI